jgi:hypothetical protein
MPYNNPKYNPSQPFNIIGYAQSPYLIWRYPEYKDIATRAYVLKDGVWHGDVTEVPNNSGLRFVETVDFQYWNQGHLDISMQDRSPILENIGVSSGHVYKSSPPPVDVLKFQESVGIQLIKNRNAVQVSDSIALGSDISAHQVKPSKQKVFVNETFGFSINTVRAIADTLTFVEEIVCYMPNVNWSNPGTITPNPVGHLTLTDVNGSEGTLTLRVPEFGDTDKYHQTRVQRTTRDGDLIVFNDPMWPNAETFHFEFVYLTAAEAVGLLTFLSNTLGRNLKLTDHYSRQFIGYLTTPEESILQPKVNGFSAKFEFQIKEG